MPNKLHLLAVAVLCFSIGSGAATNESTEQTGPEIGHRAPAFTLKDQNGKEVSLEKLLKKGPVALVFYRSADWCIYCKLQLVQLQRNLKEIETTGGQVVGISYDSAKILKRFSSKEEIAFPLLSDVGSKTIDAYDMRNKDAPKEWEGVASHGTFIIDQQGIVRAKLSLSGYEDRLVVDELVKALKQAQNSNGGTKQ